MPFDVSYPRQEPSSDGHLLRQAQQMIADEGFWAKHAWYLDTPGGVRRYCPLAAVALVCNNSNFRHPTKLERHLCRLLARELPYYGGLWRLLVTNRVLVRLYNDKPATTHADIMNLFDGAIESVNRVCRT